MSRAAKIWTGVIVYLFIAVLLYAIFGSEGKNEEFKPQDEFKLEPWIPIHIGGLDLSINKAVLYLFLACAITTGTMIWIARRMQVTRTDELKGFVKQCYIPFAKMADKTAALLYARIPDEEVELQHNLLENLEEEAKGTTSGVDAHKNLFFRFATALVSSSASSCMSARRLAIVTESWFAARSAMRLRTLSGTVSWRRRLWASARTCGTSPTSSTRCDHPAPRARAR